MEKNIEELFYNQTDKLDNCWEWTGRIGNGLGKFHYKNETLAHRVSWLIYKGEIPNDMWVIRICGNRLCINPNHLILKKKGYIVHKTLEHKLLKHTIKTEYCWEWVGSKIPTGYGHIHHDGESLYAHRASWLVYKGDIPDGMCVLHRCDNPSCVNPNHLWLGTIADNMHDRDNKGRHGKGYKKNKK